MPRRPGPGIEFDSRRPPDRRRARGRRRDLRLAKDGTALGPGNTRWLPRDESTTSTGLRITHLEQYYRGLRVYRSAAVVKRKRGRRPSKAVVGFPISRSTPTVPELPAARAVEVAIRFLQQQRALRRSLKPRLADEQRIQLPAMPTLLSFRSGFGEPVRAHLEIFPLHRRKALLAWVFELAPETGLRYEVVVSVEQRPRVLFSTCTTSCLAFAGSWVAFPRDAAIQGQFPLPVIASSPGTVPGAASNWLEVAASLRGPNALSFVGTSPNPGAVSRTTLRNAFVWSNLLHDFFEAFGFDSSLGAFDAGQDPLLVRVFASKAELGGTFDNAVDGFSPTMRLFDTRAGQGQHAALDPSILVHEYTHGVSSRLVGGAGLASPFAGAEAQGLNEGYSDYFALTLVSFRDRATGGGRDLRKLGPAFKPGQGVRDYAGFQQHYQPGLNDAYLIGQIWCAALLEARTDLLPSLGADAADRVLWQALVDSMRGMAPTCASTNCLTLAHAKDALVTAAAVLEPVHAPVGTASAIRTALARWGIT